MEAIVASVEHIKFDVEISLEQQAGAQPLPFPGMDKSTAAVCEFFPRGACTKGGSCPFRHVRGDRSIVCKHWLRGLCKKGDQCEFLHEYDMSKMPECYFYSRFINDTTSSPQSFPDVIMQHHLVPDLSLPSFLVRTATVSSSNISVGERQHDVSHERIDACHNKECPFLHIDPESKIKDCPWYDRGFCRHGPNCRHRHVRRVVCMNYLAGFCPEGNACKFVHPRFELPAVDEAQKLGKKTVITCHYCGETGHKAMQCPHMPPDVREVHARQEAMVSRYNYHSDRDDEMGKPQKPLEEVICYKCGAKGHYANKCPKGPLAFLSQSVNLNMPPQPKDGPGLMRR